MALLSFDVEHNRQKAFTSMAVVLVALIIFPFVAQQFGNSWVRIIDMALLYIMLALGLNIVVGFAGLLDLGYIAFFAVGAYMTGLLASPQFAALLESVVYQYPVLGEWLVNIMGSEIKDTGIHLSVWLIVPLGAAMAGLFGALLGAPTLKLRGDYLAIVTLGFAEIIRIVILNIDAVGGATGYQVPGYANFLWIGIFAIITVVVIHNIVKSDTGRALISIREDELAAEAMGVNTTRYKVTSFVIGSAFAGVAGVLFAHYNKFLHTNDFQFIRSFEIIIMIVIGGMGSMTGAILGAIIVTLLPELLRQLPDIQVGATTFKFADLRLVIFALILILTMILRPQGILGTAEIGGFLKRFRRADKPTGGLE